MQLNPNDKKNSSFFKSRLIYKYTLNDAMLGGYLYSTNPGYDGKLESDIYKEINQKLEFAKETLSIGNVSEVSTLEEVATSLEIINNLIKENQELYNEIKNKRLSKEDITALGNKKEQLEKFEQILDECNYIERDWQKFFELNTWIFGYGLNYIFNSSMTNKKLEQVISSYNFNQSGKRIDALMKTQGLINSLCFVEIKTPETRLLDKQYRNESWSISTELAGAIAQVHKYRYNALKDISNKIEIKSKNGDKTGEVIYNYSPRLILVIGNLNEFMGENGVNEDKLSSFEMFRKSIEGIDIITFDELYHRAKYIIES